MGNEFETTERMIIIALKFLPPLVMTNTATLWDKQSV
jgi:hypothetical protein